MIIIIIIIWLKKQWFYVLCVEQQVGNVGVCIYNFDQGFIVGEFLREKFYFQSLFVFLQKYVGKVVNYQEVCCNGLKVEGDVK